jgi:tetratricopeptide (TPR) repeat protein
LSLISLYIHLSKLIVEKDVTSATCKELYEIGRWYEYIGAQKEAVECYTKVAGAASRESEPAKKGLAGIYKKQKRYDEALVIWRELSDIEMYGGSDILIEMAKVYEHHYKDIEKALFYAKRAYRQQKQTKFILKREKERELQECLKRINRLERKCRSD